MCCLVAISTDILRKISILFQSRDIEYNNYYLLLKLDLFILLLYDRDFVSVRQIAAQDGCYYAASQATITALKPEQPGKVRYVCAY